jgi:hypothetical protein
MANENNTPVAGESTIDQPQAELQENELDAVSGGDLFGDIWDAVNDAWTDIKHGFMDALND